MSYDVALNDLTSWKHLVGHAGHEITALSASQHYDMLASGDCQGIVCLWDRYRLNLICQLNTNIMYDPFSHQPMFLNEKVRFMYPSLDREQLRLEDMVEYVFGKIDGLCFHACLGELTVARWNILNFKGWFIK